MFYRDKVVSYRYWEEIYIYFLVIIIDVQPPSENQTQYLFIIWKRKSVWLAMAYKNIILDESILDIDSWLPEFAIDQLVELLNIDEVDSHIPSDD